MYLSLDRNLVDDDKVVRTSYFSACCDSGRGCHSAVLRGDHHCRFFSRVHLFLHHVLPILHVYIAGSLSRWSNHLVLGLLHRSTGRTAWFMDSVTNQLIGLFAGRFYSMLTSPPTSWPDYSSLVLHHQLRLGLLGAQTLLDTPETPRCSDIASYVGYSLALWFFMLED